MTQATVKKEFEEMLKMVKLRQEKLRSIIWIRENANISTLAKRTEEELTEITELWDLLQGVDNNSVENVQRLNRLCNALVKATNQLDEIIKLAEIFNQQKKEPQTRLSGSTYS